MLGPMSIGALSSGAGAAPSSLLTDLKYFFSLDEVGGDREDSHGSETLTEIGAVGTITGRQGLAALFDGSVANHLRSADTAALSAGAGSLTLAFSVRINTKIGTAHTMVSKWAQSEYTADLINSSDRFRFYANNGTSTVIVTANNFGSPALDTRYDVRCGYDAGNSQLFIQVDDGTPDTIAFTGPIKNSTANYVLGARSNDDSVYANPLYGDLDCVGAWDRLLTDEEWGEYRQTTYPFDGSGSMNVMDGVWTWFNDPRAVEYNSKIYVGTIDTQGSPLIAEVENGQFSTPFVLKSKMEVDDHDNPGLLVRDSDKRILAFYAKHNTVDYYMRVSTNAEDATAFDAESNISGSLTTTPLAYANPIQLLDETNDPIYLFYRAASDLYFTKSTDGGVNWAAGALLVDANRPYNREVKNGEARIDFCINDNHPIDNANNSTYHFYYEAGNYFKSDGTLIGDINDGPFVPATHFTQVHDGSSGGRTWVWDIAIDGSGNPVIVYAKFPTDTDHRYRYAKWNGTSWDDYEIVAAGGPLYSNETYYSGGIALDHGDINTVYCSRKIADLFQVFRYTTADGGETWSGTQLTESPGFAFRPVVVRNYSSNLKLLYCEGAYRSYTDYGTIVRLVNG